MRGKRRASTAVQFVLRSIKHIFFRVCDFGGNSEQFTACFVGNPICDLLCVTRPREIGNQNVRFARRAFGCTVGRIVCIASCGCTAVRSRIGVVRSSIVVLLTAGGQSKSKANA